ncbi:hypothetical protein FOCC_FOCC016762 [Frankliniella occidentalis]|nr:hypothetical protein FOCC_FOCC016762 [Frankliniella occidentalis]
MSRTLFLFKTVFISFYFFISRFIFFVLIQVIICPSDAIPGSVCIHSINKGIYSANKFYVNGFFRPNSVHICLFHEAPSQTHMSTWNPAFSNKQVASRDSFPRTGPFTAPLDKKAPTLWNQVSNQLTMALIHLHLFAFLFQHFKSGWEESICRLEPFHVPLQRQEILSSREHTHTSIAVCIFCHLDPLPLHNGYRPEQLPFDEVYHTVLAFVLICHSIVQPVEKNTLKKTLL